MYNSSRYLAEAIESVLNQSHDLLELIIVDDGSTDESAAISESFAAQDARVKLILVANGGAASARNIGVRNAVGEYVTFLDADDRLDPDFVSTMYSVALHTNADLVSCAYQMFGSLTDYRTKGPKEGVSLRRSEAMRALFNQSSIANAPWGKLFRRGLFESDVFPVGVPVGEDLVGNARLIARTERVELRSEVLYWYRTHSESATRRSFDRRRALVISHLLELSSELSLSRSEKLALHSRVFAESLYIGSQASADSSAGDVRDHCAALLRSHRGSCLANREARRQLKAFAVISYLSPYLALAAFRVYARLSVARARVRR